MLERIKDIFNTSYETKVSKPTEDILNIIREGIGNSKWHSSLTGGYVNFNEIKINGDKIEILRSPGMFTPFKSHGRIVLHLMRTEKQDLTRIKCEILPGDNTGPYFFGFLLVIFLLWTMFLLSIGLLVGMTSMASKILTSIIVFSVIGLIMYVKYRFARVALTDYSESVIKLIRA